MCVQLVDLKKAFKSQNKYCKCTGEMNKSVLRCMFEVAYRLLQLAGFLGNYLRLELNTVKPNSR